MPKTRNYTSAFRQRAVRELLESGRPLQTIAEELHLSANTLRAWRDRALHTPPGITPPASNNGSAPAPADNNGINMTSAASSTGNNADNAVADNGSHGSSEDPRMAEIDSANITANITANSTASSTGNPLNGSRTMDNTHSASINSAPHSPSILLHSGNPNNSSASHEPGNWPAHASPPSDPFTRPASVLPPTIAPQNITPRMEATAPPQRAPMMPEALLQPTIPPVPTVPTVPTAQSAQSAQIGVEQAAGAEKIRSLQGEVEHLRRQREILKQAIAILSQKPEEGV